MELYKSGCRELAINGVGYQADERGIVEVPDDKINSSVWAAGWVSAAGRLKTLEAEHAMAAGADETPSVAPAAGTAAAPKPVDKNDGKLTKTD